jgi:Spy/CpxP family protein refolding chaperone
MRALYLIPLAALLLGGEALAEPGPGHGPGPGPGPGMLPDGPGLLKIAQMVGLSEAQIKKIRKVSYDAKREAIEIHYKLQKARLELYRLMQADKVPSDNKALAQVDRVGRLETQMKKAHVKRLLRIRRTMSTKQWRKLQTLHAEHRMGRRGGRRGPPGPPGPPR